VAWPVQVQRRLPSGPQGAVPSEQEPDHSRDGGQAERSRARDAPTFGRRFACGGAGCGRADERAHCHDHAEAAALSEAPPAAARAAAPAPWPLMSAGDGTMTALTAWQRRDRVWARVQTGCAVVAIVSATLLLCW
jgi:hypothetical protein